MSTAKRSKPGENTGRWTKEEHEVFITGLKAHGKEWKTIADMVGTRTVVQIRTHAQKYFQKLAKMGLDPTTHTHSAAMSGASSSASTGSGSSGSKKGSKRSRDGSAGRSSKSQRGHAGSTASGGASSGAASISGSSGSTGAGSGSTGRGRRKGATAAAAAAATTTAGGRAATAAAAGRNAGPVDVTDAATAGSSAGASGRRAGVGTRSGRPGRGRPAHRRQQQQQQHANTTAAANAAAASADIHAHVAYEVEHLAPVPSNLHQLMGLGHGKGLASLSGVAHTLSVTSASAAGATTSLPQLEGEEEDDDDVHLPHAVLDPAFAPRGALLADGLSSELATVDSWRSVHASTSHASARAPVPVPVPVPVPAATATAGTTAAATTTSAAAAAGAAGSVLHSHAPAASAVDHMHDMTLFNFPSLPSGGRVSPVAPLEELLDADTLDGWLSEDSLSTADSVGSSMPSGSATMSAMSSPSGSSVAPFSHGSVDTTHTGDDDEAMPSGLDSFEDVQLFEAILDPVTA